MFRRAAVLAAWVVVLAPAPGCGRRHEPAASSPELDRAALGGIVTDDLAIERTLKSANDLAARGADDEAIARLERDALPAIDAALEQARAASVRSAWGALRRDEWVAILGDRRKETGRYAAALRDGSLEARAAAMQAQAELTRRAMAAAKAVQAGPT
jgi:hypothetical protein